jgi:cation transport ATPase
MFRYLWISSLLIAITTAAQAETVEIQVNGLVCAFCAQGIEKTLRAKPATEDVYVSLETGLVALTLKAKAKISDTELRTALTESGYTVTAISRTERTLKEIEAQAEAQTNE